MAVRAKVWNRMEIAGCERVSRRSVFDYSPGAAKFTACKLLLPSSAQRFREGGAGCQPFRLESSHVEFPFQCGCLGGRDFEIGHEARLITVVGNLERSSSRDERCGLRFNLRAQ